MPTIELQGTVFGCEILAPKQGVFGEKGWTRLRVTLKNGYLDYQDVSRKLLLQDVEEWIFAMRRLLAGAYTKEYSLMFEGSGLAVDLYPSENSANESREERRNADCVMAVRILMRSADQRSYLGGVYTLLFHRKEIELFSRQLGKEFHCAHANYIKGKGKLAFAGVSPLGYGGCCYWYLCDIDGVTPGDYVWVRMGKHNTEQVVLVDELRCFSARTAPYDPKTVKRILRKATDLEVEKAREL